MARPPRPSRPIGAALVRGAAFLRRKGLEDARLDADLLLGEVLGEDRAGLLRRGREPVGRAPLLSFARLLRRRRAHEPVAYLRGRREFHGLEFLVRPGVLIPRPETEIVVARALERLGTSSPRRVLDVGTGSGAIAVTLAAERPGTRVFALDLAAEPARVAAENAQRHGLCERVSVLRGDVRTLARTFRPKSFDLVVSNPPYVDADEEALEGELRHEPRLALVGDLGPFPAVYRLLAEAASTLLSPGGALVLEIGARQGRDVRAVIEATGRFSPVTVTHDLAGEERVVEAVLETSPED